jgi:hypothetical protein
LGILMGFRKQCVWLVLTCAAAWLSPPSEDDTRPVSDVCGHSTGLDMGDMAEFNVSLIKGQEPRLGEGSVIVHVQRNTCGKLTTRTRTEPLIGTEDSSYGLAWLVYTATDTCADGISPPRGSFEFVEVALDPLFEAECTDILFGLPDNHKFLTWTIKTRNVSKCCYIYASFRLFMATLCFRRCLSPLTRLGHSSAHLLVHSVNIAS